MFKDSSNTENEAIQVNTGINTPSTNMTNEVRLKECEKKLDIKDNSKNEEMGRNNNETDLKITSHETSETLTASEPKGMSAIAQVLHLSCSVGGEGGGNLTAFPDFKPIQLSRLPKSPGKLSGCLIFTLSN